MRPTAIFLAFLAVTALAIEAPIPGYNVVDIVWQVDPFGNGTIVELTGTVQQVHDKIKVINPEFAPPIGGGSIGQITTSTDDEWSLMCGGGPQGFTSAERNAVLDGITYLHWVTTKPSGGPGPGNCGRVSCSWNAGIWWCNDNKENFTLDSFDIVADCAQKIVDKCSIWEYSKWFVLGQNFHTADDWNCLVHYAHDIDGC